MAEWAAVNRDRLRQRRRSQRLTEFSSDYLRHCVEGPGCRCMRRGYVYRYARRHPNCSIGNSCLPEHRLVMELKIGRYLEPGENVHHINGQRDDNRPENLELWVSPPRNGIRNVDAVLWASEVLQRNRQARLSVEEVTL